VPLIFLFSKGCLDTTDKKDGDPPSTIPPNGSTGSAPISARSRSKVKVEVDADADSDQGGKEDRDMKDQQMSEGVKDQDLLEEGNERKLDSLIDEGDSDEIDEEGSEPNADEDKPQTPKPGRRIHKTRRNKPQRVCMTCGSKSTPQWRSGPLGRGTLCNA